MNPHCETTLKYNEDDNILRPVIKKKFNEGVKVNQEIDDLREGLRETVKAIAEELEIKPSLLNKAIRIAQKGDWNLKQDEMDDLEAILTATGRN